MLKALLNLRIQPKVIRFEHVIRDEITTPNIFIETCTLREDAENQVITESYDATAFRLNLYETMF